MKINNSTINYLNNTVKNTPKQNKSVSFGANPVSTAYNAYTKNGGKLLEPAIKKVANNGFVKKFINSTAKSNNGITNLLLMDSVILSSFYMINTAKNKKIEKKQRMPLVVNQALVFGVATALTLTTDKAINKTLSKFKTAVSDECIKKGIQNTDGITKGIGALGKIAIFGLIYRFITPVLITPIANKISGKIRDMKQQKQAPEETTKTATK